MQTLLKFMESDLAAVIAVPVSNIRLRTDLLSEVGRTAPSDDSKRLKDPKVD
jgi:hypothetical protein